MKRLTLLAVLLTAAACGSDNAPADLCTSFVNAINAKASSCQVKIDNTYLNGCKSAINSCSADDKTKMNAIVTCTNNVAACTSLTTFENAVEACVTTTGAQLSAACQTAMSNIPGSFEPLTTGGTGGTGGTGSFAGAGGSCTISAGGTTSGCIEWSSSFGGGVQTACTSYCTSGATCTYSSGACSSTGRVGRCLWTVTAGGTNFQEQFSWYSGTAAQLQQACQAASQPAQGVTTTWIAG